MTESVRVLIPEEEVNKRIKEMAEKISADIGDETITLICILKGSVFLSWQKISRGRSCWILCP